MRVFFRFVEPSRPLWRSYVSRLILMMATFG